MTIDRPKASIKSHLKSMMKIMMSASEPSVKPSHKTYTYLFCNSEKYHNQIHDKTNMFLLAL